MKALLLCRLMGVRWYMQLATGQMLLVDVIFIFLIEKVINGRNQSIWVERLILLHGIRSLLFQLMEERFIFLPNALVDKEEWISGIQNLFRMGPGQKLK